MLDDDITPYEHLFIRMNGLVPQTALDGDAAGWTVTIDGEVDAPLELSIEDLKSGFENVTSALVLECGGNGRAFFNPGASGNQWTTGAVGCPEWTGVRLEDVLAKAGVKDSAVYTAHYGNDVHLSGDPEKEVISRGVPIDKAMAEDGIIAWAMNGKDIPALHGFPLRLVIPGYPGSVCQKYLTKITIRDREHDGAKMTGYSYRLPAYPVVARAQRCLKRIMVVMTEMPVKSLVTFPRTGTEVGVGHGNRGARAMPGRAMVTWRPCMSPSISARHWQEAAFDPPPNRFRLAALARGCDTAAGWLLYEVWARATDKNGLSQPVTTPGWNPRGYGNNMVHRIALIAT